MYKILKTDEFEDDVIEYYNYLFFELELENSAHRLLMDIDEAFSRLYHNPYLYQLYHDDRLAGKEICIIVIKSRLLVYKIDEDNKTVTVIRFLNAKSDITRILK